MNYQNNEFQVIVGIDFGTDGSGMSYAVKGSRDVHIHNLNSNDRYHDAKTKTNILLDYDGSFIAFGHEATEKYILQDDDSDSDDSDDSDASDNNIEKKQWLLFEKFKMNLYDKPKDVNISPGNDRQYMNDSDEEKEQEKDHKIDIRRDLVAMNGQKMPAEKIFVEALTFMKNQAFVALKSLSITNIRQIQWVLTVPAIWSDRAKALMEQWAFKAGMVDKKIPRHLIVAYEPDCASISILNEIEDLKNSLKKHRESRENSRNDSGNNDDDDNKIENGNMNIHMNINSKEDQLLKGEKYILLDLGGGTADIACHEIISSNAVKQICIPKGGPYGSAYIDGYFRKLLQKIFPKNWVREFSAKYSKEFAKLLQNFQSSKCLFYSTEEYKNNKIHKYKNLFDGNGWEPKRASERENISKRFKFNDFVREKSKIHNITIPYTFYSFMESKLEKQKKKIT